MMVKKEEGESPFYILIRPTHRIPITQSNPSHRNCVSSQVTNQKIGRWLLTNQSIVDLFVEKSVPQTPVRIQMVLWGGILLNMKIIDKIMQVLLGFISATMFPVDDLDRRDSKLLSELIPSLLLTFDAFDWMAPVHCWVFASAIGPKEKLMSW